jgi:hypothetical protein
MIQEDNRAQAWLAAEDALVERLRALSTPGEDLTGLRERVLSALRRETTAEHKAPKRLPWRVLSRFAWLRSSWTPRFALAAIVVMAFVPVLLAGPSVQRDDVLAQVTSEYSRVLEGSASMLVSSADAWEVADALTTAGFDMPLSPNMLEKPGLTLHGARVTRLCGCPSATIVFECCSTGRLSIMTVTETKETDFPPDPVLVRDVDGATFYAYVKDSVTTVFWRATPDCACSFTALLEPEQAVELASSHLAEAL